VLLLFALLFYLPGYEDARRNAVTEFSEVADPQVLAFHDSLFIADLHADSLLWKRDLLDRHDYGHVDLPRMIDGNMALQVFSVVTKTPFNLNLYKNSDRTDTITPLVIAQRWPVRTWGSLFQRALYQSEKLHQYEAGSGRDLQIIRYRPDFLEHLRSRAAGENVVAALLSLEGAHALEGDIDNLNRLFEAGFRVIGLTHFFDNRLGGSAHGMEKGGITPFGLQVLRRAGQLGVTVDISHSSPELIDDIFAATDRPIIATHTGAKGICEGSPRNLSDQHIRAVAKSGGLIGVGFWPSAVCADDVAGITDSIKYVVDLTGDNHVALGSDFDGNVQTPFDVAHLSLLTESLLDAGFRELQVRKIMGENVQRFLLETLPDPAPGQ
jgi:microsomal dipeptidase-like Zn-dependent dipeptidase